LTHGNPDYAQFAFDSGVEFPPHNLQCNNQAGRLAFHEPFSGYAVEYAEVATAYLERRYDHANVFRGVIPGWDNTARTGSRAVIVLGSTPENYEHWLAQAIRKTMQDFPGGDRLVFINAWNEWAEGCHLEPDRRYGRAYLEATRVARRGQSTRASFMPLGESPDEDEAQRTLLSDLHKVARYHAYLLAGRLAAELKKHPRLRRAVRWLRSRLP
jgi:lipopolysaccharide biosynthesis protein